MPNTQWVGEYGSDLMDRWDVVCLHTIVGNPPAHAAQFSVRADGWIYQSRDTKFRSAANYQGNYRVIAIENDDHGPEFGTWNTNDGHAVPAFTAAQVESNAQICAWAFQTHGVPLVACPDSRPTSRGIAYHRQGIDGNWAGYAYGGRVSGGEVWTQHYGKVCPGDRRISQVTQIIARARVIAGLDKTAPAPFVEEDEVKTYYLKGDSDVQIPGRPGLTWGDAAFIVEADVDGLRKRHIPSDEWAVAQANGAKLIERPQAFVDSIPYGAKEGLFWWETP